MLNEHVFKSDFNTFNSNLFNQIQKTIKIFYFLYSLISYLKHTLRCLLKFEAMFYVWEYEICWWCSFIKEWSNIHIFVLKIYCMFLVYTFIYHSLPIPSLQDCVQKNLLVLLPFSSLLSASLSHDLINC